MFDRGMVRIVTTPDDSLSLYLMTACPECSETSLFKYFCKKSTNSDDEMRRSVTRSLSVKFFNLKQKTGFDEELNLLSFNGLLYFGLKVVHLNYCEYITL